MSKEFIESLRERFDNKTGPITMGELDLLIRYAQDSLDSLAAWDVWFEELTTVLENGPK